MIDGRQYFWNFTNSSEHCIWMSDEYGMLKHEEDKNKRGYNLLVKRNAYLNKSQNKFMGFIASVEYKNLEVYFNCMSIGNMYELSGKIWILKLLKYLTKKISL